MPKAVGTRSFYRALAKVDPLSPLDEEPDTRKKRGWSGPNIFVSFSWADIGIVRRVISSLRRHQQRYFALTSDYLGLGSTPGENSENAVREAGGVIIVLSRSYIQRFDDDKNGNIARELFAMRDRLKQKEIAVVCLAADKYTELEDAPHRLLDMDGIPYVGPSLVLATDRKIDEAVSEGLGVIRKAAQREATRGGRRPHNRVTRRKAHHR